MIYLTNLSALAAEDAGRTTGQVGTGNRLGIMRWPPTWCLPHLHGHVVPLMPPIGLFRAAKVGRVLPEEYFAELRKLWDPSTMGPGQLIYGRPHLQPHHPEAYDWDGDTWVPINEVQDGDTLVCICGKGKPCHRQLVAEALVAAGWDVTLDGVRI